MLCVINVGEWGLNQNQHSNQLINHVGKWVKKGEESEVKGAGHLSIIIGLGPNHDSNFT